MESLAFFNIDPASKAPMIIRKLVIIILKQFPNSL